MSAKSLLSCSLVVGAASWALSAAAAPPALRTLRTVAVAASVSAAERATTERAVAAAGPDGAVLRFVDCKTRQTVVLVGCMHYNPQSITLAAQTVRDEARAGRLRAVVIESCSTRWNNTLKVQPAGPTP